MSAPSGSLQLSDQDLLAKGGHGAVYRCTSNGQQIAVKVFDSATADAAKREVSALQRIGANCPSIVKCFAVGTASTPGSTALSMELATAGDAFKDMSDAGPQGYGDSRRLEDAARALASATSHCHAHGVAHRDIKPENVLMFRDHSVEWPRAKLCDFGAAAIAPRSALPPAGSGQAPPPLLSSRTVGSSQYCAPEIMAIHHARRVRDEVAGSGAPTPVCVSGVAPEYNAYAADVWSWAVTVYVLGSRKVPFKKAHVSDYRFRAFLSTTQSYALGDAAADVSGHRELTAREAGYVWKWPGHFSTGLIELLSACMRFRADERPSMGWVLSHRWMCEKEDLCVLKAESSSVAWLSLSPREDTTGDVTFSRGGDGAPSGRGSEHRTKLPPLMTHGAVTQGMAAGESYPLGPPLSPGRSSMLGGSIVSRVAPSSMVSQASMFSATSSAAASTVPSHSAASSAASQRLEPVVEAPYSAAADAYRMGGDSRYAQHVRLGHESHTDAAAAAGGVHGGLQKLPVQSVWGEL